jgi:EAL domain-containing protein (putative c-di-GMP-specific phosphodiesterase class I)
VTFLEKVDFLVTSLQDKFSLDNYNIKLEFYLSYSEHNSGSDIRESIHKARLALTYAKTNNESSLVAYDAILEKIIRREEQMKERIEYALENDQFEVYYQPKINTITKEIISVEALARWKDGLLGKVSPNDFIPLIEKMNKTIDFGKFIVNKVFSDFENISQKYGNHVRVSINISPSHLISGGFTTFIKNSIINHNIASNRVIIELTEEVVIGNLNKVSKNINELKKIGVAISLDDFGSGYSSLNYLARLNIDEIKIDKTFVEQINRDHKVNVLLDMLIKLSKAYHLNIVAEGVETYEQYDFLKTLGCDEIQGYLFYRPEAL